jgi:hypothetical protein
MVIHGENVGRANEAGDHKGSPYGDVTTREE